MKMTKMSKMTNIKQARNKLDEIMIEKNHRRELHPIFIYYNMQFLLEYFERSRYMILRVGINWI